MDKKLKGAVVALIGSLCYGGAQLMDIEERIAVLEELAGVEPAEEPAEEPVEEPVEELSDEDKIEAEEADAESQPLIEAEEE